MTAGSDVITVTRVDFTAGLVDQDVAGQMDVEVYPDVQTEERLAPQPLDRQP